MFKAVSQRLFDVQGEVDQWIKTIEARGQHDISQEKVLIPLKGLLIEKNLSAQDFQLIANYLFPLVEPKNRCVDFNMAATIMIKTKQCWMLSLDSLAFFKELHSKCVSPASSGNQQGVFDRLLVKLRDYCDPAKNHLYLNAHHIDSVIGVLRLQQSLHDDILQCLEQYLLPVGGAKPDIRMLVKQLYQDKLQFIEAQANTVDLLHHTIPHAYEVRVRAMLAAKALRLFLDDEPTTIFLRKIIQFSIACHDFEQKKRGMHATVEQATAEYVMNWFIEGLDPAPPERIKNLIRYVVQHIIVLGTTMVYSPSQTSDLSELAHVFEKSLQAAKIEIVSPSNIELVRQIKAMTLITGVCDKNPAAIYDVVFDKYCQQAINSLSSLKQFYPSLELSRFFNSAYFIKYYDHAPDEINGLTFFISIVPHMCMRAEMECDKQPEEARPFIEFIKLCQTQQKEATASSEDAQKQSFLTFFEQECRKQNIYKRVQSLFFSKIQSEQQFCLSQSSGLKAVLENLQELEYVDLQKVSSEKPNFIEPEIPLIDAKNLFGLAEFFSKECDFAQKERLINELLMNILLQDGAIYERHRSFYESMPATPALMRGFSEQEEVPLSSYGLFNDIPHVADEYESSEEGFNATLNYK